MCVCVCALLYPPDDNLWIEKKVFFVFTNAFNSTCLVCTEPVCVQFLLGMIEMLWQTGGIAVPKSDMPPNCYAATSTIRYVTIWYTKIKKICNQYLCINTVNPLPENLKRRASCSTSIKGLETLERTLGNWVMRFTSGSHLNSLVGTGTGKTKFCTYYVAKFMS